MYSKEWKKREPAPNPLSLKADPTNFQTDSTSRFPVCKLHGCRIVERFPEDCPLATEKVYDALFELKVSAGNHLHPSDPKLSDSLDKHEKLDICSACIRQILRNVTVQRLRQALKAKPEPALPTGKSTGNGRIGERSRGPREAQYV